MVFRSFVLFSVEFVAVGFEAFLVLSPVLVHFYEDLEIDAFSKELFEGLSGLGRHLLKGGTSMSDDDAFLAFAFHEDDGTDMDGMFSLLEAFDHHLGGIGHLLVIVE